jgi:flagellar motility protein MotE (MotC chaperone)
MKAKLLPILTVVLGLLGGIAGGLLPIMQLAPELVAAAKEARAEAEHGVPRPAKPWDFWTIEIENLTAELKEKTETLSEREAHLDARETRIAAEMAELEKTRKEIAEMRRALDRSLFQVAESESKNLRSLATTYAAIEPQAAIAILSEMDETTVVKILSLMKPDSVAAILGEMGRIGFGNPEVLKRAASLSEKLRLIDRVSG